MGLLRKISFLALALLFVNFLNAQEKASPAAVVTGKINGSTISINYSSPSVKGRQIWGALVPYNEVWRAGANEATTFETDNELIIEGSKLPAGKYSFFVIPNEKECVIIFNKEPKQWGAYKYNPKQDQLRVTVKQKGTATMTEKLVYIINNDNIVLSWEKWNIPFSVK
ncbi:DUF2911 domain-containing protein [Flavobacterium urumqiense]|uniref:DUF2911 domain-containing protein n=1 Tax=Flavobacterium urumqiense TaxID=935224 RepID=A0A1H5W5Y0_9FLAO|nr:DUF2911 domain-containing protein [Flavobacterium urumqiense]SEF94813.1 Protein of unknown function [Flavobacterium urumqiense]